MAPMGRSRISFLNSQDHAKSLPNSDTIGKHPWSIATLFPLRIHHLRALGRTSRVACGLLQALKPRQCLPGASFLCSNGRSVTPSQVLGMSWPGEFDDPKSKYSRLHAAVDLQVQSEPKISLRMRGQGPAHGIGLVLQGRGASGASASCAGCGSVLSRVDQRGVLGLR